MDTSLLGLKVCPIADCGVVSSLKMAMWDR